MRLLFVANDPPGHAVYRYRCAHLAEVLRSVPGFTVDVVFVGDPRIRVDHDIVVLHRICWNTEVRQFLRAAHACGAVLVYSTDDYIFEESILRNDPDVSQRIADFAPRHRAMMQKADALLVSTDFLVACAGSTFPDKPVSLIRNFLSREMLEQAEAASPALSYPGKVVLGYLSGSSTHDGDLASIAGPLARLLDRFPDTCLLLVGPVQVPEPLLPFQSTDRIKRHPFVPYTSLPGLLASLDINLAPLQAGRPFNLAKSEIKLLEAAAVGRPTIVSALAGFAEVRPYFPAAYATSEEDWERELTRLASAPEERRQMGNAAKEALKRYGAAPCWQERLPEIFTQIGSLPHSQPARRSVRTVNWPLSWKQTVRSLLSRPGHH